ncbi:MAG: hypothetical protein QF444_00250 [Phycisphaerales bacterium]|jgi:hypothetical protein|nr:hypothetical protein [Phycisphaerales bacterium]MDP6692729.1 hypothetical protein [Phycisphaerales bacterium]
MSNLLTRKSGGNKARIISPILESQRNHKKQAAKTLAAKAMIQTVDSGAIDGIVVHPHALS